jgi:signal transduction histidine kinase
VGDEREQHSASGRLETARASARSHTERTLALVLDRLLVDAGAALGRLVAFDATGKEAARVERGPLDEARVHAALENAAQLKGPHRDGNALTLPIKLADRALAIAFLDGLESIDPAVVAEATLRAAIGTGNALVLASSQARTYLIAELAHEIRNPLAGILAFSDLLPEEASELPQKYLHLMSHIQGDAQRLKRLIEGVLSMVGPIDGADRLAFTPFDMAPILDGLAERFAPWAQRRGIAFSAAAGGVVLGDREAIALAVANLVANALTATPSGGTVAVKARPGPDREPRWGAPGRALWLDVTDTGPGLSAGTIESARGGGLHIARDLVTALGGALWAEDMQSGARLVLRLPASPS